MDRRDFIGQLVGGLVALASLLFPSAMAAMTRRPKPAEDKRLRYLADFSRGPILLDLTPGDDAVFVMPQPAARAGWAYIDLQVRR